MKALINCVGFIGDNLFASSIAKKLKEEGYTKVDLRASIAQPYELLTLNPYIDEVYLEDTAAEGYDRVFNLSPVHRRETPVEQLQQQCGISNTSPEYFIHTNKAIDSYVQPLLRGSVQGKTLIAYMSNWEEKTFGFTEEEYKAGVNVPNLGYGGRRRNTSFIVEKLSESSNLYLIPVGMPNGFNQKEITLDGVSNYTLTASIIKACDWFIGAEGGLANLAAGVGTRTILTDDYVHQLYGWNGVIEKVQEPKLGPKYYFPEGHHVLSPYLSDSEVTTSINSIVCL